MLFTNNASTTLASSILSGATSLTVFAATGGLFPTLSGGQYFYITLQNVAGTVVEIVKCTARSGDILTIVRAQDNTIASGFASGDKVELRLVAAELNNFPKLDETNTFPLAQTFTVAPVFTDAPGSRTALGVPASGLLTASGLTQTTGKLLGRSTAATGAIEEITIGVGLTLSAGSLTNSQTQTVATQLITDSTDIAVGSFITPAYSNVGSSFTLNIPTNGYISIKAVSGRLLNDATASAHYLSFGLRIGTTNYWFGTYSVNGTTLVMPSGACNTAANNYIELNGNTNTFSNANITFDKLSPLPLGIDVVALSLPTGSQTVQLIAAWQTNAMTIKGTVKQTRVLLEIEG